MREFLGQVQSFLEKAAIHPEPWQWMAAEDLNHLLRGQELDLTVLNLNWVAEDTE